MESLDEERRLLQLARAGDAGAFSSLYELFARPLYVRVLLPRLADHAAAEDALAETFSALLTNIQRVQVTDRSLWHWLARVGANKAMDQHRSRGRGKKALGSFERLMAPLLDHDTRLLDDELGLRQAVRTCLAELNERYARAIELRFFEMKSREEAAQTLEIKVGTFDVVLLRALKAFRKQWDVLAKRERLETRAADA